MAYAAHKPASRNLWQLTTNDEDVRGSRPALVAQQMSQQVENVIRLRTTSRARRAGAVRGQGDFGAEHRWPTGLRTNIPLRDRRLFRGRPLLHTRQGGTAEYARPPRKTGSCCQTHPLPSHRSRRGPWAREPLQSLPMSVLRRCLDRGLLSGKGVRRAAATQSDCGERTSSQVTLDSDSKSVRTQKRR